MMNQRILIFQVCCYVVVRSLVCVKLVVMAHANMHDCMHMHTETLYQALYGHHDTGTLYILYVHTQQYTQCHNTYLQTIKIIVIRMKMELTKT